MTNEQYEKAKQLKGQMAFAKSRIIQFMDKEFFFRNKHTYKDDLTVQQKAELYASNVKEWTEKLDNLHKQFAEL